MNPGDFPPRIRSLIEKVRGRYDHGDPSHDFSHILRVVHTCREIGNRCQADLEALIPAALLHDVINVPKNHPDRAKASERAALEAREILAQAGFSAVEIDRIAAIIREHSYSAGKKPSSIESAVLQDADRLDALGAIGLMRMITCGAKLESRYYDFGEPIPVGREPDDRRFVLDHLYVKLFKLPELMNTSEGRAEALRRSGFMRDFVKQLETEIPGQGFF